MTSRHGFDMSYPPPVLGIDEAGYGTVAGPATVAGVWLPQWGSLINLLVGMDVRDSKRMSLAECHKIYDLLRSSEAWWSLRVVEATPDLSFRISRAMMDIAYELHQWMDPVGTLLIDGSHRSDVPLSHVGVVKGDDLSLTIACASIIARSAHARIMVELGDRYPGYGLVHNLGYPTQEHIDRINEYGPCAAHRMWTKPVRRALRAPPVPKHQPCRLLARH